MKYTRQGWPEHYNDIPDQATEFYAAQGNLSEHDDLLLFRDRMIVPKTLTEDVLTKLHDGHQGIFKCRERASMSVWWPRINSDIRQMVALCEFCKLNTRSQKREPLKTTPLPGGAWHRIGVDLCEEKDQKYMVVSDYYSRYLEIVHMTTTTASQVIGKLKATFARWGILFEPVSNNGPPFSSDEFASFSEHYGSNHTSSPHYPQSNGMAETAVHLAEKIIRQDDPLLALMSHRAMFTAATKHSPSQLMTGRQIQTRIPMLKGPSEINWHTVNLADSKAKEKYRKFYDRGHGITALTPLQPGDAVRVRMPRQKTWSTPAKVLQEDTLRSYTIDTGNGVYRRNRNSCRTRLKPASQFLQPTWNKLGTPSLQGITDPATPTNISPTPTNLCTPTAGVRTRRGCESHRPSYLRDYNLTDQTQSI